MSAEADLNRTIAWFKEIVLGPKKEVSVEEDVKKTHPNFTIVCDACKSKRVIVDSNVGFSDTSGAWGGVDLTCLDCGAETTIWEPY